MIPASVDFPWKNKTVQNPESTIQEDEPNSNEKGHSQDKIELITGTIPQRERKEYQISNSHPKKSQRENGLLELSTSLLAKFQGILEEKEEEEKTEWNWIWKRQEKLMMRRERRKWCMYMVV